MISHDRGRYIAQRIMEAVTWQLKLDGEADEADREKFEDWLRHPDNATAWAQLSEPLALIGDNANESRMVSYRQAALSDVKRTSAKLNRLPIRWRLSAVAAISFLMIGASAFYLIQRPEDYTTAFGERRVVTLLDGSKISLDSDSEVTVRYTGRSRELKLIKGQARFDVAHDAEKPFSVLAGGQKVIATGTAFNIDMTQPDVLVTLIEGHVVILDEKSGQQSAASRTQQVKAIHPVELHAGQQLVSAAAGAPIVKTSDIQEVVAWTNGQLVFDDQPLSEVVARVNHYTRQPIAIVDREAGELRISGSFNTGDVLGFIDIVTRYLPVRESVTSDGRILLRKKT